LALILGFAQGSYYNAHDLIRQLDSTSHERTYRIKSASNQAASIPGYGTVVV